MKAVLKEAKEIEIEKDAQGKSNLEKFLTNPNASNREKILKIKKEKVISNVNVCEKKSKKANAPQTYKKIMYTYRRQISFTEKSSEEDIDESKLCDDDEMDDMVVTEASEKCLVCGKFGGTVPRTLVQVRNLWNVGTR